MQENQTQLPVNQSISETVIQTEQLPKKSNFLVILLSSLLIISLAIAGFFAFQTQKLVKELTLLRIEPTPVVTAEPTIEPVATNSATPDLIATPKSIVNLFDAINKNFNLSLVQIAENQFYSPTGMISKKSWKIDLVNSNLGKSFTTYIATQLSPNFSESAGGGGGGVDAYENSLIKCFHVYGFKSGDPTNWKDPFNYLSCAEK